MERDLKKRVVITGIGAVSPAGNTFPETWRNFQTDQSFISAISLGVGDYETTELAGELTDFDVYKYGASRQVRRSDLFAHYGMAAGVEAMINSGRLTVEQSASQNIRAKYSLVENDLFKTDKHRLGVIYGIAAGGTKAVEKVTEDILLHRSPKEVEMYSIPMLNPARAATETAIMVHAKAGAFSINSACASGLQAILEGYYNVLNGRWDVALVGGAERAVHAVMFEAFKRLNVLGKYNPDQDPKTRRGSLDSSADGIVIGAGAGAMVLERLSDALDRGAPIIAEFAGGHFFTDPDDELDPTISNIELLIGTALENSKTNPEEIDHSNNHAGGSKRGDGRELDALENIFKDHARAISITASKSRIGHLMGAAGAIEGIITAKEVQTNTATATLNVINPVREGFNLVTTTQKRNINAAIKISLGLDGQFCAGIFKKFVL